MWQEYLWGASLRKLFIIILLGAVILSGQLQADEIVNGDGSPVDYSKIGVSARYWGMGKAGTGFCDDSGAMLLNPASLGLIRSVEVSAMSTKVLGEFNYSLINGVMPLKNETVGLSLLHEDAGTIYSTDGLDIYGHPIKGETIENYNRVFTFGYGRKLFLDNLYLGAAFKYTQKKLSYVIADNTAADVGLLYRWDQSLSFGMTVKNAVQNGIVYSNGATPIEHLDADYITGVAWTLFDKSLLLAVDQHSNPKFGRTNLGAEYWLGDAVALRCGLAERELNVGVGLRYESVQFDTALSFKEAPLENQIFFSLTFGNARRMFVNTPEIEIVDSDKEIQQMETKRPSAPSDEPEQIRVMP